MKTTHCDHVRAPSLSLSRRALAAFLTVKLATTAAGGTPQMEFSSFLGGSGNDFIEGVAVDRFGNTYVVGRTSSHDLRTLDARDRTMAGTDDAFVAKIDSGGNLVFTTYLGGTSGDYGWAIAVDDRCNIYVGGSVSGSWDFPRVLPLQTELEGGHDAFVAKLDASGTKLLFSTLVGGSNSEVVHGIAVDADENLYLAGVTSSEDFPLVNPAQKNFAGQGTVSERGDGFVAKIDTKTGRLSFSTFLGGSDGDVVYSLALDPTGGVHVAGFTASPDFPVKRAFQPVFGGGIANYRREGDGFIARLGPDGDLDYSTYIGGSGGDYATGIAVDPEGAVFVTGRAESSDFPLVDALPTVPGGDAHCFLMKFAPTGDRPSFSTFLTQGTVSTSDPGVALNGNGEPHVVAQLWPGGGLPLVDPLVLDMTSGEGTVLVKLTSTGQRRLYSSFLGSGVRDNGRAIAIDPFGNVTIAGYTPSSGFAAVRPFQASYGGGDVDGFVTRIRFAEDPSAVVQPNLAFTANAIGPAQLPANGSPGTAIATVRVDRDKLHCEMAIDGLTSPLTAAYLRGPAQSDAEGGIVIPLAPVGSTGTSGKLVGTLACGSAHLSELVNGLWYVELRTAAYPHGELRGQLQAGTNTPPTIGFVTGRSIGINQRVDVAFPVGDAETAASDLQVTAASSNDYLFPPGSLVLGGAGTNRTLTLAPRVHESGISTITLAARDTSGGIVSTSFRVVVERTDENFSPSGVGTVVMQSPNFSETLRGTVEWGVSARRTNAGPEEVVVMQNRGCAPDRIASGACAVEVITLFLDGRLHSVNFDSDVSVPLDTTTIANGRHELVASAWGYPDSGVLVGLVQRTIHVDNGRAPMELRLNWREIHLGIGETASLSPRISHTNGDSDPITDGLVYSTEDPSVANVNSTGSVTGTGAGVTTITASAGGMSAKTRVFVAGPAGLPHFSRDGRVLMEYDPSRSLFVRTMFVLNPDEVESKDGLVELARRAGVNAFDTGFYGGPKPEHLDFESWRRPWASDGHLPWDFKERTAKTLGFSLLLTGDAICRTPPELRATLNHPLGPESLRYALTRARDSGIVVGIEMVDEVTFLWGNTPTPNDGRWLGIDSTLTDDVFVRLMNIMNGVPDRPAITWQVAGLTGPEDSYAWMGRSEFADYATHYWALLDYRSAYHLGGYSLPQILRNMGENVILTRQAWMQRGKPQFALVGVSGPFYAKLGEGTQFVMGRDRLQNGLTRPQNVIAQIVFAAVSGMSGVRAYGLDTFNNHIGWKAERAGAPIDRGDLQTGADPFTVGTDRWDAMSKAFNFVGDLEPLLLQRRIHAVDLGGNVASTAREGRNGTLLLAINMSESAATVRADLVPYFRAGEITRLRLTTAGRDEERFVARPTDELTLASGEAVAWILNRPGIIRWPRPADIVHGNPLTESQLGGLGSTSGNITFSPPLGTILPAGRHTLTATFVPDPASGLAQVTEKREINVLRAVPVVVWDTPRPVSYGTPLSGAQLCASAGVSGRFLYSHAVGAVLPVGKTRIDVTFTPDDLVNFHRATATTTLEVTNSPPVITVLANRTAPEEQEFVMTLEGSDADQPPQVVTFSLGPDAPPGMVLSADGKLSWKPTEADGPGTFPVTIIASDSGTPSANASVTITIQVGEVNSAPKFHVIDDQSVEAGRELRFTATAMDVDLPMNALTFTLGPDAPAGVKLAASGAFTWTPTDAQGGRSYPITLHVTDDGVPPLADRRTFRVTVATVEREIRVTEATVTADGRFSFSWNTRTGGSYRVQYKENSIDAPWIEVQPPTLATGESASFEASVSDAARRFYRVVRLP